MIDSALIRVCSLDTVRDLGYPVNDSLPLLEQTGVNRSRDDVVDRLLAMHCAAACAYGLEHQKAIDWLRGEARTDLLTNAERRFLHSKAGDRRAFMFQIEGMWAFAWSIGLAPTLDFGSSCPQDFVLRMPNLKTGESSETFRNAAVLRPSSEIAAACDLAYCLHWAIRDAQLSGAKLPGKVEVHVIVERRRSLEWLLTDASWEDVALDT